MNTVAVACLTLLSLAAIVSIPICVRIMSRASTDMLSQMLGHLESAQTVGGTPADIIRQQATVQADAAEIELEERRSQIQQNQLAFAAQRGGRRPGNGAMDIPPEQMGFPGD